MYLIQVLILLLAVYAAPALAVWPRLPARPLTAAGIPVLSAGIAVALAALLSTLGLLQPLPVRLVSLALVVTAGIRLYRARGQLAWDWPAPVRWCAWLAVLVCLPLAVRLGLTSFATNDEIYSWNLWAIQHLQGVAPDFHYTRAPYPQGFALLLAWGYALLGSPELALPLRFTLGLFPFAMALAVAAAAPRATPADAIRFAFLLFAWFFLTATKSHLDNGLADPMMAASLVVAVALYLDCRRGGGAGLAPVLVASLLAAMTKQPAIAWTCIALPVLLLIQAHDRPRARLSLLLLIGIPAAWALGAGHGFWENRGVISHSMAERSITDHLLHAAQAYFVDKPAIPLLLLAAGWAARRDRSLAITFWLATVPMLAGWLLFGAYDMRLGIHVLALSALLIAASGYDFPLFHRPSRAWTAAADWLWRRHRSLLIVVATLSMITSALIVRPRVTAPFDVPLSHAGRRTVIEHFGAQSDWVMQELYGRPDRLVYAPSNYVYGIFYGSTPVIRPDYGDGLSYGFGDFIGELQAHRPLVAIDPGILGHGNAAEHLRSARADCPRAFLPVGEPGGKHGFQVLVINYPALDRCWVSETSY